MVIFNRLVLEVMYEAIQKASAQVVPTDPTQ